MSLWLFLRPGAGTPAVCAAAVLCLLSPAALGLVQSVGPEGINARIVHQQGITGRDIHVGLLSAGNVRVTHEAFALLDDQTAVANYDFSGKGFSITSHDTQVAAIVVSRGGAHCPECRGAAPDARLHSARISDGSITASTVERALRELIVNRGCRVIVTGIQLPGDSSRPDGNSVWSRLYDFYAERYDVLFANAAGNSDSSVTVFGDGYNGVTTGGLALDAEGRWRIPGSISNPGPTVDGRRKPELMAPAHRLMMPAASGNTAWSAAGSRRGETSYAAPHTAGVAALLLQRAAQTECPLDDKSLTLKAILVNTADPNLHDRNGAPTPDVWHPQRGYGRVNAARALHLLNAGRIQPETTLTAGAGWACETIEPRQHAVFRVAAQEGQQLNVTLTWHRKLFRIGTLQFAEETPPLNLSLDISAPDGTLLFSERDTLNNLRKAALVLPGDGEYEIVVRNLTDRQRHPCALAVEVVDAPPALPPADS